MKPKIEVIISTNNAKAATKLFEKLVYNGYSFTSGSRDHAYKFYLVATERQLSELRSYASFVEASITIIE